MRNRALTTIAFAFALAASACTLPEGETPTEGEAVEELESWTSDPGITEAARNPRCSEHYACCIRSGLGDVWDGWNQGRCDTCQRLCRKNRLWPYYTPGGDDCQWWQEKYGRPSAECRRLVR